MKSIIVLISIVFLFSSCAFFIVPKSIKKNFDICYTGEKTGLDSLINLNGYYSSDAFSREEYVSNSADTTRNSKLGTTLVLFPDGRAAYSISHYEALKQRIISGELNEKESGKFFYWGNYYVKGDSIIVQYITLPTFNIPWEGYESIYTIKNRNTLSLFSEKPFRTSSIYHFYEKDKGTRNKWIYSDFVFEENNFHPEPNIPKRFRKLYECE